MKKQLLAAAFLLLNVNAAYSFDEKAMLGDNQWFHMEKTFITDINSKQNFLWAHIQTGMTAMVALTSYYHCNKRYESKETKHILKSLLDINNIYLMGAISSTSLLGINGLTCYINNRVNRQALLDFLINWETNKFYTPEELQETFITLKETMQEEGEEAVLQHANKVVGTMKFLITRHFSDRYKKCLEYDASNSIGNIKTIGEIIKNTIGTAKDLAA